jgi:hypothetical protein
MGNEYDWLGAASPDNRSCPCAMHGIVGLREGSGRRDPGKTWDSWSVEGELVASLVFLPAVRCDADRDGRGEPKENLSVRQKLLTPQNPSRPPWKRGFTVMTATVSQLENLRRFPEYSHTLTQHSRTPTQKLGQNGKSQLQPTSAAWQHVARQDVRLAS